MTDASIPNRKAATILDHVARIRRRRPTSAEALKADVDLQDAIGMSFVVAMQNAVDLALHVASTRSFGMPAPTAESFRVLGAHGHAPQDVVESLVRTTALRNRSAHGDASVDFGRLWSELPSGLDALERLAGLVSSTSGEAPRSGPGA